MAELEEATGERFELGYAPSDYGTPDLESDGRWYTLRMEGNVVGTIWTDDAGRVGFAQDFSARPDDVSRVVRQLDRYAKIGFDAETVFDAFPLFQGNSGSPIESGKLREPLERATTAAIEAPAEEMEDPEIVPMQVPVGDEPIVDDSTGIDPDELEEYNFVAIDENDEVVGVGRSTAQAMLLRDNGAWVPLPDDDLTFDGCEWLTIDDATLTKYDERIEAGLQFTREDVEDPIT